MTTTSLRDGDSSHASPDAGRDGFSLSPYRRGSCLFADDAAWGAYMDAFADALMRIDAIMACRAATSRRTVAAHLALHTDWPAETAIGLMGRALPVSLEGTA